VARIASHGFVSSSHTALHWKPNVKGIGVCQITRRITSRFRQLAAERAPDERLKDAGHLFRFAGLFVLAFLVFLVVRGYVVPKSFGQYGHYRGAAIGEIASHPVKFAGHQTCETCHTDEPTPRQRARTRT
jgi:hypothetical protein